jgi:hypothetical protein
MDKHDYITSIQEAHENLSPTAFKKAIEALGYSVCQLDKDVSESEKTDVTK